MFLPDMAEAVKEEDEYGGEDDQKYGGQSSPPPLSPPPRHSPASPISTGTTSRSIDTSRILFEDESFHSVLASKEEIEEWNRFEHLWITLRMSVRKDEEDEEEDVALTEMEQLCFSRLNSFMYSQLKILADKYAAEHQQQTTSSSNESLDISEGVEMSPLPLGGNTDDPDAIERQRQASELERRKTLAKLHASKHSVLPTLTAPVERVLKEVYDLMLALREIELHPDPALVSGGFLKSIDNFTAILLYKDVHVSNISMRNLRQSSNVSSGAGTETDKKDGSDEEYLRKLERGCFDKKRSRRICIFSFVIMALIITGSVAISSSWENSSRLNLDTAMKLLHSENEALAASVLYNLAREGNVAMDTLLVDDVYNEEAETIQLNGVSVLEAFDVDGFHVTLDDGRFYGVYRPSSGSEGNVEDDSKYVSVTYNTTSSKYTQCSANVTQLSDCMEWTDNTLDPQLQPWYVDRHGWTRIYSLLRPRLDTPTVPDQPASTTAITNEANVGITLTAPLRLNNSFIGVVGVDLRTKRLQDQLAGSIDPMFDGVVYICDTSWNIIASTERELDIPVANIAASDSIVTRTISYLRGEFCNPSCDDSDTFDTDVGLTFESHKSQLLESHNILVLGANRSISPATEYATITATYQSNYRAHIDSSIFWTVGLVVVALVFALLLSVVSYRASRYVKKASIVYRTIRGSGSEPDKLGTEEDIDGQRTPTASGRVETGSIETNPIHTPPRRRDSGDSSQDDNNIDEVELQLRLHHEEAEEEKVQPIHREDEEDRTSEDGRDDPRSMKKSIQRGSSHLIVPSSSDGSVVDRVGDSTGAFLVQKEVDPAGKKRTSIITKDEVIKNKIMKKSAQDEERELRIHPWPQWMKRVVTTLLIGVVLCLGLTWVLWSSGSRNFMEDISAEITSTSQSRILEGMQKLLSDPQEVAEIVRAQNTRGEFAPSTNPGETYDRYLAALMRGFSNMGRPNQEYSESWEIGNNPISILSNIYFVDPNNTFVGASFNEDTKEVEIAAQDPGETNCYRRFRSKPVVVDETTVTASTNPALVRDESQMVWEFIGCKFDFTDRLWYQTAVNQTNGQPAWTPVYQFFTDESLFNDKNPARTGVTLATAILNGDGSLHGVLGIDVELQRLSEWLFANRPQSTASSEELAESFIMDRNADLIASSVDTACCISANFAAVNSENTIISETAEFLVSFGLDRISGKTEPDRPFQEPITAVEILTDDSGLDWIVVVAIPFSNFFQEFDDRFTRSFIISAGALLLVTFAGAASFTTFKRQIFVRPKAGSRDELLKSIGSDDTKRQRLKGRLASHLQRIRELITDACVMSWHLRTLSSNDVEERLTGPVRMSDVRKHYRDTAIKHIQDAQDGRDVITICLLTVGSGHKVTRSSSHSNKRKIEASLWPLRIYRVLTSVWYRVFLNLVLVVHVGLYFAEPDTYKDLRKDGVKWSVLVIEAVLILIEVLDIGAQQYVKNKWMSAKAKFAKSDVLDEDSSLWDRAYSLLICLILVDFLVTASSSVSVEYLIPLRPFLIVLKNPSVREAAHNFFQTLSFARDVFLLYVFILIIAAAMGLILFGNTLNTDGPESSYTNFVRAITTTLVYVTTGENYTELIYPTFSASSWYIIYWIIFCLVGLFFVLAMLIGMFQYGYKRMGERKRMERTLYTRSGMVAAFVLLDLDNSGELSKAEMAGFLQTLRPSITTEQVEALFEGINDGQEAPPTATRRSPRPQRSRRLDSSGSLQTMRSHSSLSVDGTPVGPVDDTIDVEEFVKGIEELSWQRLIKDSYQSSRSKLAIQLIVLERSWFERFRLVMVLTNVWIVALYGIYDFTELLDVGLTVYLFGYVLELLLRIYAYGWNGFWHYASYHDDETALYEMMANRFDFFVIFIPLAVCVVSRSIAQQVYYNDDEEWLRFFLVIPLLRLLSVVKRTRHLVFTLISIIPQFIAILVLLIVVFFIYGVIGVWMLSDEMSAVLQTGAPEGNFDNLSNALLTLFQLLVGEGWHEVMYAAIRTTSGFAISWYFISFVIIVTLLFTNVFIGIVLDAFQENIAYVYRADAPIDKSKANKDPHATVRTDLKLENARKHSGFDRQMSRSRSDESPFSRNTTFGSRN